MNPLTTVCSIHGAWLTPVATRTLARVRHAGDLGEVVRQLAIAQRLDHEPACGSHALWLQDLCTARTAAQLPWGMTRTHDLIRILDAVAREVIAASVSVTGHFGLAAEQ